LVLSCLAPFASVGNLPINVSEAELRQAVNELMVQSGGTAEPGFPITSCKLYQVCVVLLMELDWKQLEGQGWQEC
jgi:hypothetical protein